MLLVLAACGGGGGGGVGGGQDPDPVVLDVPIAYVKRPIPVDGQGDPMPADLRRLLTFNPGADLYVRERAAAGAAERNVTDRITGGSGLYDVRDLEVSFDGGRVLFAMRGPFEPGADDDEQPTWNIWEYTIATDTLRQIIDSELLAEAGQDVAPQYLPDGRIVFSSTRQRQAKAVLLDEGKPQFDAQDEDRQEPAFVLHVMNADGSDIHQVSFNQSHDLDPTVLSNGQVLFSRWDNAAGNSEINLYRMNPDGTDLELYYGSRSHDTGTDGAVIQFAQPREMADGRILTVARPFRVEDWGGDLVMVDAANFVENLQPVAGSTLAGPAQERAVVNDVRTDDSISPGGEFSAAYPLWDGSGRMFVSWSPCRLLDADDALIACTQSALADPDARPAPPLYGIWIYDRTADTQLPVFTAEEGVIISDVVAAQPRSTPPVIFDQDTSGQSDPDLVDQGLGLIDIRSVYDLDGRASRNIAATADPGQTLAADRPARFLRLEKAVALPDREVRDFDNSAFGVSQGQGMREILGYVPVEPDGSVVARVPANVPLALSVLDADGRRISERHQNWLQVRPGQVLSCNGCHSSSTEPRVSHGRRAAFDSVWPGATADGQPFPHTDPALFADQGETMAQVKKRISCATDCALVTLSVDVVFEDIWTDAAAAGRPKDASFAFRYADLTTPPPTSVDCLTAWTPVCRITIHYEAHIHPLWSAPRQVLDVDGTTVLADHTCTTCHAPADAMGAAQVPAGQLDLTDGPSDLNADHFKAYRELLSGDNEQVVTDGALQDRLVEVGTDPVTGDPVFAPVPVNPVLSTSGSRASPGFFSRFAPGGSHEAWLSTAELKLLSEWVDIGAQYYNSPFQAPLN